MKRFELRPDNGKKTENDLREEERGGGEKTRGAGAPNAGQPKARDATAQEARGQKNSPAVCRNAANGGAGEGESRKPGQRLEIGGPG